MFEFDFPPLSVRQYLLFSFFLSLSFLLSYFFYWGGGGGSTAWEARPFRPPPRSPSFPFSFLLPLFSFPFSPLSLSLLFLSSLSFFFFFFLRGGGGGQGPLGPPPLDPRLNASTCIDFWNQNYLLIFCGWYGECSLTMGAIYQYCTLWHDEDIYV